METDNRIKVIYIKNALPSHEIDYLPQFALNSNFNCTCLRSRQYEQPIYMYISLPKLDLLSSNFNHMTSEPKTDTDMPLKPELNVISFMDSMKFLTTILKQLKTNFQEGNTVITNSTQI